MDPSSSLPVGDSLSIVPYEGRTEIFFFVEFNVSYHLAESGMETVTITLCRWVRRIGTSEFRKKRSNADREVARCKRPNHRLGLPLEYVGTGDPLDLQRPPP